MEGAPCRGIGGVREGAWVGRAPAGSGSGRHVEEGTWCCSNDDACRSAAPPIAPLPSRRVAASRGQYRWCGGGGSLHRPAAGAAITSMRGGLSATRVARGLRCAAQALLPIQRLAFGASRGRRR